MENTRPASSRTALALALAVFLGLVGLGLLLRNAAISVRATERTVSVKGLSEREVPADVAAWPITFQVVGNDLDDLFAEVTENAGTVRDFLAGFGIEGDAVTLGPPAVTDRLAQNWGNEQNVRFRYSATGTVTVYTTDVDAVREAMSSVVELGKRGVVIGDDRYSHPGGERFLFTGLSALKPEMIEEATKNARAVAEKFAVDSGSRLGKIRTASQGLFTINDRDSTTPHIKKVRVVSTVEYYLAD